MAFVNIDELQIEIVPMDTDEYPIFQNRERKQGGKEMENELLYIFALRFNSIITR